MNAKVPSSNEGVIFSYLILIFAVLFPAVSTGEDLTVMLSGVALADTPTLSLEEMLSTLYHYTWCLGGLFTTVHTIVR